MKEDSLVTRDTAGVAEFLVQYFAELNLCHIVMLTHKKVIIIPELSTVLCCARESSKYTLWKYQ